MTPEQKYPFKLVHAFFSAIKCERKPQMPEHIETNLLGQVKIDRDNYPHKLQVNLKLESSEDSPLTVHLELIGLFELLDGYPEPDIDAIQGFLNEQALHMLWPYAKQMILQMTGQMGMNPVNMPTPYYYNLPVSVLENKAHEEERVSNSLS